MEYEVVIGLEVHVELLTETKLFCGCPNRFTDEPNRHTCEVCLGFPGALPHLNEEAVHKALTAALALNCEINLHSRFDRKNYFYPDMPKGYQISQYFIPLGARGFLEVEDDLAGGRKTVGITRVHLEEDAGKLIHSPAGDCSLVDYNRAGVPLVEIVSEPDLRSPAQARSYLENLKSLLQYAAVSDCKMEEGSLRCDANISLRPRGSDTFGNKTELKNMNSFKAVEKALEYEIERQAAILRRGEQVIPQTRRWDEDRQKTFSMRDKLQAHDYRCFVDPELAPIELTPEQVEAARAALPEMAPARRARYVEQYGLPAYDAGVLTATRDLADYFEACLQHYPNPKTVSNWLMGDFLMQLKAIGRGPFESGFTPAHLAELLKMIDEGTISGKQGKEVLEKALQTGRSPQQVVEEEGMRQLSDLSALETIVERIIAENPSSVESYRGGKKKALGFLVGQVMKATGGRANPQLVNKLLAEKLG